MSIRWECEGSQYQVEEDVKNIKVLKTISGKKLPI
jgi:hypothetical protein